MKKRLLVMFLTLAMVLTMLPMTAGAEEVYSGTCGDNLTWSLENGTLTISGLGNMTNYNDPWNYHWPHSIYSIRTVIINNGVSSIGEHAFSNCTSLTNIVIPNSVTSIGNFAFSGCSGLTNVTIPSSVTSIGMDAFRGCTALTSAGPIGGGYSYEFGWKNLIPDFAFSGCTGLTNVTIPDGIIQIRQSAFVSCSGLTSITIPSSVTYIGGRAFYGCAGLTNVVIPSSVTSIDWFAFAGCSNLKDVYFTGSEAQWKQISIDDDNDPLTSATIHYNSTGPNDVGPDNPNPGPTNSNRAVFFLTDWNATTRTVKFGEDQDSSFYTNTVAESVNVSDISNLLNRYVLVTYDWKDTLLNRTITNIQPVESAVGTVSATGEHSMTIDGKTYPVREDYLLASNDNDGDKVLYHTYNGTIMDFSVVEEKHGEIQEWNSYTGRITIDGAAYPTNYLSNLSFVADIGNRLNKQYYFTTAKTDDYTVLLEITEPYYPGGNLEDFNADIYHATWLSKHGNSADILGNDTPSEILINVVSDGGGNMALDMWKSLELVFDTVDDVAAIPDFLVKPRDMYSALILDALEASVSYDVVPSQFEDSLSTFRRCLSDFSTFVKKDKGIDLNNDDVFQNIASSMPGVDVDVYTQNFISDWYKKNYPNVTDVSKYLGKISKGIKAVGSLEDFAEYCATCVTLMNVSDSMKTVLERACLKSAEIYGPLDNMTQAFNDCLQMITRSTDELFDQIEKKAVTVVGKAGWKYIVSDLLWNKVSEQIQISCPEVAILKLIYEAEKTATNMLFGTEDAAEKYLKMEYITDIESLIDATYRDLETAFRGKPTLELAQAYLSAMELSFRLRDVDSKTAYGYVENIQSSAFGSLKELLGASNYEGLKKSINTYRQQYTQDYTLAETGWVSYLEEDYPGSGLYELYSSLYELMGSSSGGFRLVKQVTVACPVNVYVYDYSNHVVASVVDGRVSCSADDVMIALIDDEKVIRFYDGADYRLEYVGYAAGDMDVTITEFDGNEDTVRTVNYYDVPLTNGKTYSMALNTEKQKPYNLVDQTNHAAVKHEYDSRENNASHTIKVVSGTLHQNGKLFTETTASKGETLQLNAYVPEGNKFVRWEVSTTSAKVGDITDANTTIIMPDEPITVTAVMAKIVFTDVPTNAWYSNAVYWAVENNITIGTSATTFSPNKTCTNAEIITFLYRANNSPKVSATLPFIPKNAWATDALKWAYSKGIIGADFDEQMPCTRYTTVEYFWKAFGTPNAQATTKFTDISGYNASPLAWAVQNDIVYGTSATTFSPDVTCNRAMIVTLVQRAYDK